MSNDEYQHQATWLEKPSIGLLAQLRSIPTLKVVTADEMAKQLNEIIGYNLYTTTNDSKWITLKKKRY